MRGKGHCRLSLSPSRIGDDVGDNGGWGRSIDTFYVREGRVIVVVIKGGKGGRGVVDCHCRCRRRH